MYILRNKLDFNSFHSKANYTNSHLNIKPKEKKTWSSFFSVLLVISFMISHTITSSDLCRHSMKIWKVSLWLFCYYFHVFFIAWHFLLFLPIPNSIIFSLVFATTNTTTGRPTPNKCMKRRKTTHTQPQRQNMKENVLNFCHKKINWLW